MGKLLKLTGYSAIALFIVFAIAVFVFSLPSSGWRALSVQTGSMRPAIDPGALVLVHRVPDSSLQIGDVITYNSKVIPGETVTHRIIAFKQLGPIREIIVKGDANKVSDPPLLPSQVVGKVEKSVPKAGYIIDVLHRPIGLILIVYFPALIMILYEIKLMTKRLTDLEVSKKLKEQSAVFNRLRDKQHLATETITDSPKMDSTSIDDTQKIKTTYNKTPRRRKRSIDGFGVILVIALVGFAVHPTFASLTAHASIKSITIATKATNKGGKNGDKCSTQDSNNTNTITVNNNTTQTSTSGNVNVSGNTTVGNVSTGNSSNTNTSTTTIIVDNCE